MITIGIDANEASTTHRVGSNIYAYRILQGLHRTDTQTHYRVYLKHSPQSDLPQPNAHWQYRLLSPSFAWTQWRLPLDLYLHQPRPCLFFTPGHYAPRFSPVPTLITILDLAFLHYPKSYTRRVCHQLTNWTRYSAFHAHHILTISQHTKQDIIRHYHLNPNQITVTYPGPNLTPFKFQTQTFTLLVKRFHLPKRYLIYIGTRQPRKNLSRLITAVNHINSHQKTPVPLLIVGKIWHQFSPPQLPQSPHVIYTDYLPQSHLKHLLQQATALVLPSLYEGFGFPVLEAMNLRVPVAASNTSSLPEITGSSWPFLFNPTSVSSITHILTCILNLHPSDRKKWTSKGKIRAKQFSWSTCIKQTQEVLHELPLS